MRYPGLASISKGEVELRTERYFSQRYKSHKCSFREMYQLLSLRYHLGQPHDDLCRDLVALIKDTDISEIYDAFFQEYRLGDSDWGEFLMGLMNGIEEINYISYPGANPTSFMKNIYIGLAGANKYDPMLSELACIFFDWALDCPVGHLLVGAKEAWHDWIEGDDIIRGYFAAGRQYHEKSLYQEGFACYKLAMLLSVFGTRMSINVLDSIRFDWFSETTRKITCYQDSIRFLKRCLKLKDIGFPLPQGYSNECEILCAEFQYDHNARTYRNIDNFYQMVAKEDFAVLKNDLRQDQTSGKYVLTGDQLELFISKIEKQADIINAIRGVTAQCDQVLYMQRETFYKQSAIFDAIKDQENSFDRMVSRHVEQIIENLRKSNEVFRRQVNINSATAYYRDSIGQHLWETLDVITRDYLMLGHHLFLSHEYAPADEFGFVAIQYALAIENEFKKKVIDSYIVEHGPIRFTVSGTEKVISGDSKVVFGDICLILDKARKSKKPGDPLWNFHSFLSERTVGSTKTYEQKGALYEIKDKYRNPAAHPTKYPKSLLQGFRELLFEKLFLCKFLGAIQQIEKKD